MSDSVPSPESHWYTANPSEQPAGQQVMGLPRMVLDVRAKMGGNVTPEQVVSELQACGVNITVAEVEAVWDEGHVPGPKN